MKLARVAAALFVGALLAFSLAVIMVEVIEATRAESPAEGFLAREGFSPRRTAAGAAAALDWGAVQPGLFVVLGQPPILAADETALLDFVSGGGDVWVFSHRPGAVLPAVAPRTLEGSLHGWDGGEAEVHYGAVVERVSGLVAIDVAATPAESLLVTPEETFRDTNLNGRLDIGEPAGPFVVGVVKPYGEGRFVFVASADPGTAFDRLAPPMLRSFGAQGPTVVLEGQSRSPLETVPRVALAGAALPSLDLVAALLVAVTVGSLALLTLPTGEVPGFQDDETTLDALAASLARRTDDGARRLLDSLKEARR